MAWYGLGDSKGKCLDSAACPGTDKSFADAGYCTTVLKGLGVSKYYPDPTILQGGDIDLWVDATRRKLISGLSGNINLFLIN